MRALLLALTAAVLGAPGAQAGDVRVSLQGGIQRHLIYESGSVKLTNGEVIRSDGAFPLGDGTTRLTAGLDARFALGDHWALRGEASYVHAGVDGFCAHGVCQRIDLHVLEMAALAQPSLRFGYGDRLYLLAGPALQVRLNTPDTIYGRSEQPPFLRYPVRPAEAWTRAALTAVVGGGVAIHAAGRLGTFLEAQYRHGLTDLYEDVDTSEFAPNYVDRSRGWRFVTGLSIAVR